MKKVLLFLLAVFFLTDGYARIRTKKIDVIKGEVEIKNVAGFPYDYNNFQFLVNSMVYNLSNMTIVSGSLNAGVDEVIVISGITFPAAASVSIWYPGTFAVGSSNVNLVDFMQYGSAGNPYEASADSAGLWTIGDFVAGNPPYIHTGGPFDEGASFWQPNTVNLEEQAEPSFMNLYPNPVQSSINVQLTPAILSEGVSFALIDLQGKMILKIPVQSTSLSVPVSDMPEGVYLATLINDDAILERKIILVE